MGLILVVDDEADVADGWARALRIAKHDVLLAHSPAAAIPLSQSNPLDVVVLDYMMPDMTGIELLNEIRKDHPFVRSIIISGKLDKTLSEEGVLSEIRGNISADIYLHKPVDNVRLKEAIASLLSETKSPDWHMFAAERLEASKPKKNIRAVEKKLNSKKAKKK